MKTVKYEMFNLRGEPPPRCHNEKEYTISLICKWNQTGSPHRFAPSGYHDSFVPDNQIRWTESLLIDRRRRKKKISDSHNPSNLP